MWLTWQSSTALGILIGAQIPANWSLDFAFILAGLATFLIRLSFIAAPGHIEMPMRFTHALTFVPVAVLSAIIFPELLTRDGAVILSLNNARLFTGIIAILIAWRTQNIWLTIAIGMTALFVLQITLGGQV